MTDLLRPFLEEFADSTSFWPALAIRATLWLAMAYAAHFALSRRRNSTLTRASLWNACLIGLLLLPAFGLLEPRLNVPISWEPPPAVSTPKPADLNQAQQTLVDSPEYLVSTAVLPPSPRHQPSLARTTTSNATTPSLPTPPARFTINLKSLALATYFIVALALSGRLARSLLAVERLKRQSRPVENPQWSACLDSWRSRLGVKQPVALLQSPSINIPIVLGNLRSTIILPTSLATATRNPSPTLLDAVLVHELAHVLRHDFAWNLLRRLAQILYWPHPLSWPLARVTAELREQACDDLCVHALGGAKPYRASLLEVASSLVPSSPPEPALGLGLAMARNPTTRLGRRLTRLNDQATGYPRCRLNRPARLALGLLATVMVTLIGSTQLVRAAQPAQEAVQAPAEKEVAKTQPAPDSPPDAVEVLVLAHDTGKPLANARVRPFLDRETSLLLTDAEGRVPIDLASRTFRDSLSVDIWADGYVQQRFFFSQDDSRHPKIPAQLTVELWPGEETLGGTVVNEEGQPIAGVKVEIFGYPGRRKATEELAYMVDATTDEQGQWRCRSFRDMTFADLYLSHPDYLDDNMVSRRHGQPRPSDPIPPDSQPMENTLRDFSDRQVMKRGVPMSGTVTGANGQPVASAEVGWFKADRMRSAQLNPSLATTDAQGAFHFSNVAPGELGIRVKASGHAPALERVEARQGMEPLSITLGEARTVTGRVVDTAGRPIPDAYLFIDGWRNLRALDVTLKTNAEGRFRWESAPKDSFSIRPVKAGYLSDFYGSPFSAHTQDLTLTLKRALSISGVARDAETNKPIERADVVVDYLDQNTGEFKPTEGTNASCHQGRLSAELDAEAAPSYRLRIKAKDHALFESRVFQADEGQVEYDVKLQPADEPPIGLLQGTVTRYDGTPLSDAQVVAITYKTSETAGMRFNLFENGTLRPGQLNPKTRTDGQGRFTIQLHPEPAYLQTFALVAFDDNFYAHVDQPTFEANPVIVTRPWARVEGTAFVGRKPAADVTISLYNTPIQSTDTPPISSRAESTTDDQGRFHFDRVIPTDARVTFSYRDESRPTTSRSGVFLEARPGETTKVQLGGRGRPVIAKIARPEGFDPDADYTAFSLFSIEASRPRFPTPDELVNGLTEDYMQWARQWYASPKGRQYRRNAFTLTYDRLQPDCTIRADDIPPGQYHLTLRYTAQPTSGADLDPSQIAISQTTFTVPEIPDGYTDEPLDLGTLHPKVP